MITIRDPAILRDELHREFHRAWRLMCDLGDLGPTVDYTQFLEIELKIAEEILKKQDK